MAMRTARLATSSRVVALLFGVLAAWLAPVAPARSSEPDEGERSEGAGISWALLPIVGYSPETSFSGGAKFRDSDLFGWGAVFDLQASYAVEQQQYAEVGLEDPHVFGSRFSLASDVVWDSDPAKEFFGLGNDSRGPDSSSSHLLQNASARVALGVWLLPELHYSFAVSLGKIIDWD